MKHLESIDIVKGIAIFLVVWGHAVQGIASSQHITFLSDNASILIVKEIIYSFHMPLFFIVAGMFVKTWLDRPAKKAISQKVFRLLYPYFIWSAIVAICMQAVSSYTTYGLGIIDFLKSPVVPFSQYWFLYALFCMHCIEYIFCHCFKVDIEKGQVLFLCISLFLYILCPLLPNIWIIPTLGKFMIFFALGNYVIQYKWLDKLSSIGSKKLYALWGAFECIYLWLIGQNFSIITHYVFFITSI